MTYPDYKKIKNSYDYSISKINNILANNENLEMYLDVVDNKNYEIPSDIQLKIKNKINSCKENNSKNIKDNIIKIESKLDEKYVSKKENVSKSKESTSTKTNTKTFSFYDIIKIAACTLITVGIWEFAIIGGESFNSQNNINIANNNLNINEKRQVNEKIHGFSEKVSDFFMSPRINERGNK